MQYSQQAADNFQRNSQNNAANSKNEAELTNTINKMMLEIENLKKKVNSNETAPQAQSQNAANGATQKTQNDSNGASQRTQSTPINNFNRGHTQGSNDINMSIQNAVEESMRRFNNGSLLQMSVLNQKMVEIQMNESLRNTYRVLPKVTNPDYEWIIFFQSFNESKHLFSDSENVARLQTAIECEKIRKSGGPNLFNPYTYGSTLEDLNKRIGRSENLLLNEKLKLVNNMKIRNDDKRGLINLIENIKKYSILVDKLGSFADRTDLSIISRLARLLPGSLKAKWSIEFNQLRDLYNVVHIKQMSIWLDRQINTCETELYFDKMDPYGEIKMKNPRQKPESKDSKNKVKNEKVFHHIEEEDQSEVSSNESDENEMLNFVNDGKFKKENPATYCWYHKKDNHSVLNCFSLLNKTGQEVCKIAENEGYCTKCAGKKHSNCHYNFNCIMPDCELKHAAIFCSKRVPAKSSSFQSKFSNNNKKHEQKNEYNKKNDNQKKTTHSVQVTNDEIETLSQNQCKNDDTKSLSNSVTSEPESNLTTFNALFSKDISSLNLPKSHMICEKESLNISKENTNNSNNNVFEIHENKSLLPVVVVILKNGGRSLIGAFLLDTGSSVSIIDEHFASKLGSEGVSKPLYIEWSGGKIRGDEKSQIVQYEALGIHEGAKSKRIYFRTMKDLAMPKQMFDLEKMKKKYKELRKFQLQSYSQVIGIIGQDQKLFLKQLKWHELQGEKENESPALVLTPLGYVLMGNSCPIEKLYKQLTSLEVSMLNQQNKYHISEEDEEELMRMEEGAMSIEYAMPYENDRILVEDQISLKLLESNVRFLENENRYEATLLWKEPDITMPTEASYRIAMRRLKIMMCHLKRIKKYDEIKRQIENLIEKNYARVLKWDEVVNPPKKAFYIPIFITEPKGKRIRLIWDAACKVEGKSLNDYLYSGPNLYINLLSILMTSREGKYFVKGDVSEMFHQVKVKNTDQPAMRFLFMDNEEKILHLEMQVLIFGAICAPTIAQYVKNKVAEDFEQTNPQAAKALLDKMYVDDFVISFNDLPIGKKLIKDARGILKNASFELVKLQANHSEVLEEIKQNLTLKDKENAKLFSQEEEEKILGYSVNFKKDVITLSINYEKFDPAILNGTKMPSKREFLRFMMQIYDPLGFFTFFTKNLKLIYHWICKDKLDWNELISKKQISYWLKCLGQFKEVQKIEIPRPYSLNIVNAKKKQLIICGDAGKEALCTVAYLRILNENNEQIDVAFIAAKSYIVPLKQKRTIPELEMDVAAKGVEFKKIIVKFHDLIFDETMFFTDNACVFCWIVNGPQKPTIYVNNRYNKIKSGSNIKQWNWLPSELQPADYGTKIDSIPEITYENEWFKPKIFCLPEEKWLHLVPPNELATEQLNAHLENKPLNKNEYVPMIDLNNYSSWIKAVNQVQILMKFIFIYLKQIRKLKHETKFCTRKKSLEKQKKIAELIQRMKSSDFMHYDAELFLIKEAQKQGFEEERVALKKGLRLKSNNKLYRFNPFLDQYGVLRIETRIPMKMNYHYDKKCPIILPKKNRATTLIIMHYHEKNKHLHYKTVIVDMLQRFFLQNINWEIKRTIRENCYRCKKFNAKPDQPKMGDLPSERLATFTPPFTYIIIDVCGPLTIIEERKRKKRWLFVAVCLTTRAVHIEILYSMDSESCLMALQNTINLRGAPARIISDNGTNFIGGSKILKDMQYYWNKKLLKQGVIQTPIEWDFNPARASHMNGSVERVIGLVKNTLKNMNDTLDRRMIFPKDEVLRCLICEVIGLLNNRPLTMHPLENTENEFLTPNDFLMQRNNFQAVPNESVIKISNFIEDWFSVKEFIKSVWDHFCKIYVCEIRYRDKWINTKKPLSVGDLVVLDDPTIVNFWRMGKRNIVSKDKILSKKWREKYKDEKYVTVTRPASQVAVININVGGNDVEVSNV
ncbi:hypothetical protein PVAND_013698 [Polypedilum vanderplanki]|uniref:Integrase catalytic domain-containing protein n=1 Tax=Polypedilum vanderplanki TaxID=319348 RepID=A0A9J6CR99_POLVA|nr:hypothetical protein PVAND_013698 [Polypedilum vanderplanki]